MRPGEERGLRGAGRISPAAIDSYFEACLAAETTPRVSELARDLHVSRGTLVTAFKALQRITPAKYFRQRQIASAKQLLLGNRPVEWVAHRVGYGTGRAFHRAFQAITGKTPGGYRIEQSVSRRPLRADDRLVQKPGKT
jgi:AraC-like DNA-binding protein